MIELFKSNLRLRHQGRDERYLCRAIEEPEQDLGFGMIRVLQSAQDRGFGVYEKWVKPRDILFEMERVDSRILSPKYLGVLFGNRKESRNLVLTPREVQAEIPGVLDLETARRNFPLDEAIEAFSQDHKTRYGLGVRIED